MITHLAFLEFKATQRIADEEKKGKAIFSETSVYFAELSLLTSAITFSL
jgi:hypothetical protein